MPGSQDSVTRGVQNLLKSETPATQTALPAPAPPPMPNSRRPPRARPKQQQPRIPSLCAVRLRSLRLQSSLQPWPQAPHGFRNTGDKGCSLKALRSCAVSTVHRRNFCKRDTPISRPCRWRYLPGPTTTRTSGSCARGARPPFTNLFTARSRWHQDDSLDDSPLPNCPTRDIVLTERDKQLLAELRRASPQRLSLAASSLALPQHGQTASKEPRAVTSHGLCSATVVACSGPGSPEAPTELRN